jgi:tryptophan synthase alpha chain
VLVGFGIKDKASFSAACAHANGAIIGTAFIRAIGDAENVTTATAAFLNSIIE